MLITFNLYLWKASRWLKWDIVEAKNEKVAAKVATSRYPTEKFILKLA